MVRGAPGRRGRPRAGGLTAVSSGTHVLLTKRAPAATAPDGHVAAGTEGGCIHLVTDKVFLLNTNSAGVVDVDVIESGADTWYLVLVFPNGERVVSSAITFA